MIMRAVNALSNLLHGLPEGFIRSLRWQYIGNIGAGLLGGAYFLYLGRELGLAGFGLYALCLSVASLIFGLSDMRLQEAVIRFAGHSAAEGEAAAAANILKSLLLLDGLVRTVGFLAVCALSPLIAVYIVKDPTSVPLLCLTALSLIITKIGNAPSLGLLRLVDRFDLTAAIAIADWFFRLVLTVCLASFVELSPYHILLIAIVSGGVANIFTIAIGITTWSRLYGNINPDMPSNLRQELLRMKNFVTSSHGISLLDSVVRDMDSIVVGFFVSVPAVGIYRMGKNIALLVWRVSDPIFLVVMPVIGRYISNDDMLGLRHFLKRITIISLLVAISLFVGVNLAVPIIVSWFLPQFEASSALLPWLTGWIVISLPLIWTHALAAAAGKPWIQLKASFIGNVIGVILLVLLTRLFSITGTAIAWSVGLSTTFVSGYLMLRRAKLV